MRQIPAVCLQALYQFFAVHCVNLHKCALSKQATNKSHRQRARLEKDAICALEEFLYPVLYRKESSNHTACSLFAGFQAKKGHTHCMPSARCLAAGFG